MCIQAGELFNLMGLEIGRLRALTLSPTHTVASDLTHCEPFDLVKTNQWVCALTLLFGIHLNILNCDRIQIHSRLDSVFYVFA